MFLDVVTKVLEGGLEVTEEILLVIEEVPDVLWEVVPSQIH